MRKHDPAASWRYDKGHSSGILAVFLLFYGYLIELRWASVSLIELHWATLRTAFAAHFQFGTAQWDCIRCTLPVRHCIIQLIYSYLQLYRSDTLDMHNSVRKHNPRAQQRAEARACSIVEVRQGHSSGILAVFLLFYAYLIELRWASVSLIELHWTTLFNQK